MARHAAAAAVKDVEEETQDSPDAENETQDTEVDTSNKSDLVRLAIKAGYTSPKAGSDFIKQKYGVDVQPGYYSVIKSKQTESEDSAHTSRPRAATVPAAKPTAVVTAGLAADLEKMRGLVESMGDDVVDTINEVISLHAKYGAELAKLVEMMAKMSGGK